MSATLPDAALAFPPQQKAKNEELVRLAEERRKEAERKKKEQEEKEREARRREYEQERQARQQEVRFLGPLPNRGIGRGL